jgi:predicted short-subunit dehydrogenase-like oxidoreductase (DUF2520 family)
VVAESRRQIAIVGAGAVAQALGRLMVAAGEPVAAVAARNRARAEEAARFIGVSGRPIDVVALDEVPRVATHVLIAVSDQGIEPVAAALASAGLEDGVAVHTCGARGADALSALASHGVACGMVHPLQTVMSRDQGIIGLPAAWFGLCGDRAAVAWGEQIAESVTGGRGRALYIRPDRLSYYHAGAVMGSNAVMAVLDVALILIEHAGVSPDDARHGIAPLARTSLDNALISGPQAALTGPVARGDAATVAAHADALRHVDPAVRGLYLAVSTHLLQLARQRGLPEANLRALQDALE